MKRNDRRPWGGMAMLVSFALAAGVALAGCTCGNRILGVCAEDETRCAGDAVETCTNGAWSTPVACGAGDSCSLGACSSTAACADDCLVSGGSFCSGGSVVMCGEYDSDACLDLGNATACMTGTFCSNGACAATCTDECMSGEVMCTGTGASRSCGNYDEDECFDWGPPVACPMGQSCVAGSGGFGSCMTVACMDECDPASFNWTCGTSGGFTDCGTDGDADPCYEMVTRSCDVCSSGSFIQCSECCAF